MKLSEQALIQEVSMQRVKARLEGSAHWWIE